ncbi:DNA/RNA non-specific endonuclease [Galbibacter sp. EGI 63066]|uniref:DNA/RNA non-specific endonuclease n=1 Tax=Galbibacter sp. EGI 63066 TaxID=2993559 RepID=UPI002248E867|nr:DNA/RNA non-specific endonuclease [Galbibacter sp. EGI 63066]MCX2682106.1 DNA/RNA non-specific endonuclease [Galbibacter sp. EGI 63066]
MNKIPLIKNMVYEVDGFLYQTDDLGRVIKTNADLDDIARVRLGNQQIRAVDIKEGIRGSDQGGHIVGSRFFGPEEQINLYPQSATLNQGAWKQMENSWADAMIKGEDVKIEVRAIFDGTSKRPIGFEVDYWIDGKKYNQPFEN